MMGLYQVLTMALLIFAGRWTSVHDVSWTWILLLSVVLKASGMRYGVSVWPLLASGLVLHLGH